MIHRKTWYSVLTPRAGGGGGGGSGGGGGTGPVQTHGGALGTGPGGLLV